MPMIHHCPYWKWGEKLKSHCEAATIKHPSPKAQYDFCKEYCASQEGWKECTMARALNKYYEGQA